MVHIDSGEVEEYLESLRVRKLSPATVQQSGYMLNLLLGFLDGRGIRLQDAAMADVEAYRLMLGERKYAAMTVARCMTVVRLFFRWLEQRQKIFLNPAEGLVVGRVVRPILFVPSRAQVKLLLAQPDVSRPLGVRDRAFLEVLYSTGARLQEMMALGLSDPDLTRGVLRLMGKGRKERMVPLGRQAVHWLRKYLREARPRLVGENVDEPALWVGGNTRRKAGGQALQRQLQTYSRRCGLPSLSPHALRRACATHMLANGAHPVQIQMLLGHAGMNTLGQYLRVTITDLRKAHKRSKPGR